MSRRRRQTAQLLSVSESVAGTTLSADAAVGATTIYVDDASVFDESGWLSIGGQVIKYSAIDDDAGTVTLVDALTAAADTDDLVARYSKLYDEVETVQSADVAVLGDRDQGDTLSCEVSDALDLPTGDRGGDGENCTIEADGDVWTVIRVGGRPAKSRGIRFEHAEPAYTPTSDELTAGTFTRQLLHRNIAAEHGLFTTINGVALGSEWWSLDAAAGVVTVTIPGWVAEAPEDYREFGWPLYAYRRGIAVDPPEVEPVIEHVDLLPHAVYRSGVLQTGGADIWNDASDATSTALSGDSSGSDTPAYGWLDASAIDPAKVTDIAIVARYLAETTEGVDDFPIVISIVHDDPGGGSSSPYMDVAAVRSVHSQPVITEDAWFLTDDDFANIGLTKAEVAEGLTRVRDLANGMRAVRFEFLSGFLTAPPATGTRSLTVYEAKVRVFYEVP